MHVVFRVDASTMIGTGHVVRCLTLADTLKQQGHHCRFICRAHAGHLAALIEQRGYPVTLLTASDSTPLRNNTAHDRWLQASWQQDAEDTIDALAGRQPDWLVVDHYALDSQWQRVLRPHVEYIMALDDLADRQHDVDLLVDQNFYPDMHDRYAALVDADTELLIGPAYALLRDEFIEQQAAASTREQVNNILVFFGGVDQYDLTSRTIDAIQLSGTDASLVIIAGNSNPHAADIDALCSGMSNTTFYRSVDNIAELMLKADLAIGAGGSTTWERCYLGLPAIVVTLADNQAAVNDAVAAAGACIQAGDNDTSSETIAALISKFTADTDTLASASQAAFAIMQDHVGTPGVVEAMEKIHG